MRPTIAALLERSADVAAGSAVRLRRPIEAETHAGRVRGRRIGPVLRFAGIPFAAPPVGERRFLPPEPAHPWTGVRDASTFAPQAFQADGTPRYPFGPRRSGASEDCLYLNVTTPATTGQRPVMVWLHPGGYVAGSATSVEYDGHNLAACADVVVVTVGYRLGPFGWLDLGPWDEGRGATNVGLLDQIAACRWVQDNIASFGGDPSNVTLFGASSGGASIVALMAVQDAHHLFHRAIVQSAPLEHTLTSDRARTVTHEILRECGVGSLRALQRVDGARLLAATTRVALAAALRRPPGPDPAGGLLFGPVIDGVVLEQAPAESFRAGRQAPLPLIIGTNRDEWQAFSMMTSSDLTRPQLDAWLERIAPGHGDDLYEAYRSWTSGAPQAIADAVMTDRLFALPTLRLARYHARKRADATYAYRFDWSPPGSGAVHGIEQPFAFGRLRPWQLSTTSMLLGALPPWRLMVSMRASWTTFARTGRPPDATAPDWPLFADDESARIFDRTIRAERHHLADRVAVWEGADRR